MNLELLSGPGAGPLLAAVFGAVGGAVQTWRVAQVDHQPGLRTVTGFEARVCWPDGSVTDELVGACDGELPDTVARISDGETEIGLWRVPHDPDLPGLATAYDARRVSRLAGVDGGSLRWRAYRPRRRAVLELTHPSGSEFVKVVPPHRIDRLHRRHATAFAAGCPVPEPLARTADGLLVLRGLPGTTLREALLDDAALPAPADVFAVLDRLPAGGSRRPTWGQRAGHYAELVAAVAPDLAARVRAVAAAVGHTTPEGPDVAVHGDFYECQLMVQGGRVTGLLDIDGLGTGERLDDAACLLAHLDVLALLVPARAGALGGYGRALRAYLERDLPPDALARRTAAVVLSLAPGPHRVQDPDWPTATVARVALAERWLG